MHFSRMRTVRCSGRLPGACLPREVSACPTAREGVCLSKQGVSAQGEVPLPPWTELLTRTCENITFSQLRLRTVVTES